VENKRKRDDELLRLLWKQRTPIDFLFHQQKNTQIINHTNEQSFCFLFGAVRCIFLFFFFTR